jgi:hypothetical protein
MYRQKLKNPVFLFNGLVLAAFVCFAAAASGYPEDARRFPNFVLTIGIAVIAFWMAIYFFFPSFMKFIEVQEEKEEGTVGSAQRYYKGLFCIGCSLLAGFLFGFIFFVPLTFLSYGVLLGDRKKLISLILVAAVTTVLLYFGFDCLLHIPLRKGVLLDLG